MKIYQHLCGSVIAVDGGKVSLKNGDRQLYTLNPDSPQSGFFDTPEKDNTQGSLINWQKRKVANACEYLRLHHVHKPLIFVCTTSPNWNLSEIPISKLVHNLRNGYGMEQFVWVRERAKNGAPHFHFVGDCPHIDAVKLSLYWSGLFGQESKNSVRLGSKPHPKTGRRLYYLSSRLHAWYIGKYLGKGFKDHQQPLNLSIREKLPRFKVSKELAALSVPNVFESTWHAQPGKKVTALTSSGYREIELPQPAERRFLDKLGNEFNPHQYQWKRHKIFTVYFGRPIGKPKKERSSLHSD